MKQNDISQTGFTIERLLLIKNSFERAINISFDDNLNNEVDVDVQVGKMNDSTIFVTETVSISQKKDENEQFSIKVTMVGVFRKIGETQIEMEKFGHINGAAIIFPFIREHIASLTVKSGLGIILLPPVNFEQRWESQKIAKKSTI